MNLIREMETGIQGLPMSGDKEVKPKTPEQAKQEYKLIKSLKTDKPSFDKIDDKVAQDLITQAHERAEEVETVAFGMELDDGEIVKIYVNAEQAEAFEKALGDMLGQEDDIEVAIEKLAEEYDIVSVEWPEERGNNNGENPNPELEGDKEEEPSGEEEEDKEFALDFDLSNKKKEEDKQENPGDEEDKDEDDSEEKTDDGDLDLDLDGDSEEDEKTDDKQDTEDEEEETDDEDDTEEDNDEDKKSKKKSKKKKKDDEEEPTIKESFLFAHFLGKPILTEKQIDKKEIFSKDELKIEDIFNTAFQQKIAKLLFLLDFPVDRILSKKSLFRKGIRNAALELNSNSRAKLLINRLIKELSVLMSKDEVYNRQRRVVSNFTSEDLKESPDIDEKLTNELQKLIIKLYKALGVPDILLNTKTGQLKQDIRKTAKALASHTGIKSTLKKLAKALDIDAPIEKLDEDISNFSNDSFINLVALIATQLGIPEDNLNYKKSIVIQSIKDKKQDLIPVKSRLVSLAKMLSNIQISDTQMTTEEVNSAYMHRAADFGNWNIASKGDTLTLSVEDVVISLSGKDLNLFKSSIDNGLSTLVKDGNEEWQFKAIDHGKKYIAINENSDKYMNGILLHEKDVNAILDIIDED